MGRILAPHTANERFKERQGHWVRAGLVAGVVAHAAAFALVQVDFRVLTATETRVVQVAVPPEATLPEIPPEIGPPEPPRVATVVIEEENGLIHPILPGGRPEGPSPRIRPEAWLPPIVVPPPAGGGDRSTPGFIAYDTPPRLSNPASLQVVLEREGLELGQGGPGRESVELWVYVTHDGRVTHARVKTESVSAGLDAAALRVAIEMRFTPALNRGDVTPVWITEWLTRVVDPSPN